MDSSADSKASSSSNQETTSLSSSPAPPTDVESKEKKERKAFKEFLDRPLLHVRDGTHRLMIGMIGLPACGKSYIASKIARYLKWVGYTTKVFNLGKHTEHLDADFFDPDNSSTIQDRCDIASSVLNDVIQFFEDGGQCAIYDAANVSKARRKQILETLQAHPYKVAPRIATIWVESVVNNPKLVEEYIHGFSSISPDYLGIDDAASKKDFKKRIGFFKQHYEHITDEELGPEDGYVKLTNSGEKMETCRIRGYLPTKMVFFLMNLRLQKQPIWFSRHGESQYNVECKIGGDSDLSPQGRIYAKKLAKFINEDDAIQSQSTKLAIWCSTLKRTISTAGEVYAGTDSEHVVKWRALTEINAGIYDGLTYAEIQKIDPDGFLARNNDKLNYKYPQGESYKDVIDRTERVIFELERANGPVLVVGHQAVLRCLLGYFIDTPITDIPRMKVPLHTVIKITPTAYGTKEERIKLHDTCGHPMK